MRRSGPGSVLASGFAIADRPRAEPAAWPNHPGGGAGRRLPQLVGRRSPHSIVPAVQRQVAYDPAGAADLTEAVAMLPPRPAGDTA